MKRLVIAMVCAWTAAAWAEDVAKRDLPDYDGRGEAPATAGDVAIWVPRVALSPLYLVSEYGVRRPMEWLVKTGERNHWPSRIIDFFTFDPERKTGIVPALYVERGFHPAGGFYFFADDLVRDGHKLRTFALFGPGHVQFTTSNRFILDGGAWELAFRGGLSYRDDYAYYGEGPDTKNADRARYSLKRQGGSAAVVTRPAQGVKVTAEAGVRAVKAEGSGCCDDPSVDEAVAAGTFMSTPDGLGDGTEVSAYGRLAFDLDSRAGTGTGLLASAAAEASGAGWQRWDASLGAVWKIRGRGRLLALNVAASMIEGDAPFYDLISLGGSGPLRGFVSGRLVGKSGVSATAVYEWPVAVWLDGVVHAGVGDVFGDRFDGFSAGKLRFSTGLGLRTRGEGHRMELLVAGGTRTFDDGGGFEGARIVLGSTQMF